MFQKKKVLTLAVCLAMQANFAFAYSLSGQEEMEFGNRLGCYYNETTPMTENINVIQWQEELVKANSDVLNFKDEIHDRYLHKALVLRGSCGVIESFTLPAGHIYFSEGILRLISSQRNDGILREENRHGFLESDIYSVSSLMYLLGHETGHWVNNDFRRGVEETKSVDEVKLLNSISFDDWFTDENKPKTTKVFGYNKNEKWSNLAERDADSTSIKLNESYTRLNGMAGGLIYFNRLMHVESNPKNTPLNGTPTLFHDSTKTRFDKLEKYIVDNSGKELSFDHINSFTFDNKTYTPPTNNEVVSLDRAYYVGSQLGRISKIDSDMNFYNLRVIGISADNSISALVYLDGGKEYIVDRFEISLDKATDILNKDIEAETEEELWLLELVNIFS